MEFIPVAVLADGVWLRARLPQRSGHGVDGAQLGGRLYDATRGDGRARRHLPAALTDQARKPEQTVPLVHDRPVLAVS